MMLKCHKYILKKENKIMTWFVDQVKLINFILIRWNELEKIANKPKLSWKKWSG